MKSLSTGTDKRLGLGAAITRRDFLNASLIGIGSGLLRAPAPAGQKVGASDWDGYGGVGDYARSQGNTEEVIRVAHELRDGRYDAVSIDVADTGETWDLVIVGGGLSGLGGAFYFNKARKSHQTCLILENHLVFGGESKRNEFIVEGHRLSGPQGANEFDVPARPGDPGYELYSELEVPREFEYSPWDRGFKQLEFDRTNYGFQLWVDESRSFGTFLDRQSHGVKPQWIRNFGGRGVEKAPLASSIRRDYRTWKTTRQRYHPENRFERWLDSMTYRDYLEKVMKLNPEVTRYADPILAAALGLGCDALSAYAAFQIAMPGFGGFSSSYSYPSNWSDLSPLTWHAFPGGNDGFARYFVKRLIPDAIAGTTEFADVLNGGIAFEKLDVPDRPIRMRLGATAVRVEHEGQPERAGHVRVTYVQGGKTFQTKARAVLMAAGGWISKHVVRDLPSSYQEAYATFLHSPMLVVNVALTNWRFLYRMGFTACRWFTGFGFCCNIRRPMWVGDFRPPLHPDRPVVLTFYVPFYYPGLPARDQGLRGRAELLSTPFVDYERQIRTQMTRLFGKTGFNARQDIAGIVLNRWGHAYVNPQPGFFFSAHETAVPRDIIRRRFGRIAFGHSELYGHQFWLGAIGEGRRAVEQLLEVLEKS
ncbi:MAG: NAD(P)/FAD-dependent oxidoreductase [Acidobacteriota bacterium]